MITSYKISVLLKIYIEIKNLNDFQNTYPKVYLLGVRNLIYQFKRYKLLNMINFNKNESRTPILWGTGFDYHPFTSYD
jgi:hypothetical protein